MTRAEFVDRSVRPPAPVGTSGTCTAPTQPGAGGAAHGELLPPAPMVWEVHDASGHGRDVAAFGLPSRLATGPAPVVKEGSALSFQSRRPLHPHRFSWCLRCEARDRLHVNGVCQVCGTWAR